MIITVIIVPVITVVTSPSLINVMTYRRGQPKKQGKVDFYASVGIKVTVL